MYANTPLSKQAQRTLYPALKQAISGKSQYEAVSRLLNFVQTAFVYEYDDKVWGCDRAFSRMKPFITRIAIVKTVQSYSPDWSAIC